MAVHGIRGAEGASFDGSAGAAHAAGQAAPEARVSRTPTSARPDPTRVSGQGGAEPPARGSPQDFLTTKAERDAYAFVARRDRALGEVLDRFDGLTPASYNRVLHALRLTRAKGAPSVLDALILRGAAEPGRARLAARFFRQVSNKLAGQPGRVLEHLAPETRRRLEGSPNFRDIAPLLGA